MKQPEHPTLGEPPRANPGQVCARASWVCVVLAVGISALTHRSPSPLAGLLAGVFVAGGLACGLFALGSMLAFGPRRILLPALCGIALGGTILSIAVSSFVATRPEEARLRELYQLEPLEPGPIASAAYPYRIEPPGPRWARRADASARQDAPEAELWLVDPAVDAHLIVLPERLEGEDAELRAFAERVLERTQQEAQVGPLLPLQGRHARGQWLDGRRLDARSPARFRLAIFAEGGLGVRILCYGPPERFERVSSACDRALQSFEFTHAE